MDQTHKVWCEPDGTPGCAGGAIVNVMRRTHSRCAQKWFWQSMQMSDEGSCR